MATIPAGAGRRDGVESRLQMLQERFRRNVVDASRAWSRHVADDATLSGLSADVKVAARERARARGLEGALLTLDAPGYAALLGSADDRTLRKAVYEAYETRASDRGPAAGRFDNGPVIDEILARRHERARARGFDNYAELALERWMFESTEELEHFLIDVRLGARPRAQEELEEVWRFARSQGAPKELRPWDLPYWAAKLRRERFGDLDEAWRGHLSAASAVRVMVGCAVELFGVGVEWIERSAARDAARFVVHDAASGARGTVGAVWPAGALRHSELRALFRAFGRDLHRVLAPSFNEHVAELLARVMESWCYHGPTLARLSDRGAAPDVLVEGTRAERRFLGALGATERLEPAFFELRVHRDYVPAALTSELRSQVLDAFAQVRREVSVLLPPPWNRRASSLVEVFGRDGPSGCGALWADAVAADLFAAFEEADSDEDAARAKARLGRIVSASPQALYEQFRGRKPPIAAWLRSAGITDAAPRAAGELRGR